MSQPLPPKSDREQHLIEKGSADLRRKQAKADLVTTSRQGTDSVVLSELAINGAAVLENVLRFLCLFVAYPSLHAAIAHTLWIAHTHLMDCWESTPRIAFLSPEPGSGKTRALEITETLVPRPVEAINATPAYMFRKVSDPEGTPTILFDEIDTLFGARAREHEEIRGILNAGHRRGAMAGRCVMRGKTVETEELPAYCAVALAGLGALPDTILSRSIIIKMRRRAPHERVEPYRRRTDAPAGHIIRGQLEAWASDIRSDIVDTWPEPEMPAGIEDRNADVWEALLAVADAAGGDWPTKARSAAVALVADARAGTPSLGVRLLADMRTIFCERDSLSTASVLSQLAEMDESPWAELRGRPIDSRRLANYLRAYGINSQNIRDVDGKVVKGYTRESLWDPWLRYLPAVGVDRGTSATTATEKTNGADVAPEIAERGVCRKCDGEGCAWCCLTAPGK